MSSALDLVQWYSERSGYQEIMRQEVGNALWNYIHTLAEWTPPISSSQQLAFESLKAAVKAFPCHQCAEHGESYLGQHPFDGDLKMYAWQFHNTVNVGLNKPQQPTKILCQYSIVDHDCEVEGMNVERL